ncbi:MAG: malectin domain-containing carbohydrate-binding protein, partial [Candidatus Binatia bacterium]
MTRAKISRTSLLTLLLVAALTCSLPTAEALAACVLPPAGDADCDGLADAVDPCPDDTLNHCNGPVAICATALPGNQDCTAGAELRLDLGGAGASIDCNLASWSPDSGPGSTSTATFVVPMAPIQNAFGCTSATTEAIVASETFGGEITRSYPLPDGEYTVNLLFAETFQGACVVASRTMDVLIEGQQVLGGAAVRDGFDTYLTSLIQNGAIDACGGLVVRSARVTVTGGALDITITEDDPAAGDANAALKGIEVLEFIDGCLSDAECDDGDICTEDICNAQHDCENPPGGLDTDGDGVCDPLDVCPDDGLDDFDADGTCAGTGF